MGKKLQKRLPSYLPHMALEFAIDSYESGTSILSRLEKYDPVKEVLDILGENKEVSQPTEYRSEIEELKHAGLIKCYNNYCIVTSEGKDLYRRFQNEKEAIERALEDYYRIGVKDIDMVTITISGLDSLLTYVSMFGFPKPTGNKPTENIDPLVEILFTNPTKSFTARMFSTQYALSLLILYEDILLCEIDERCKNYYTNGKTIERKLKYYGIYDKSSPSLISLRNFRLIEKAPYGRNKYELTPLGTKVARHSLLQAYIASKI